MVLNNKYDSFDSTGKTNGITPWNIELKRGMIFIPLLGSIMIYHGFRISGRMSTDTHKEYLLTINCHT